MERIGYSVRGAWNALRGLVGRDKLFAAVASGEIEAHTLPNGRTVVLREDLIRERKPILAAARFEASATA
jgi:hypothetical protein